MLQNNNSAVGEAAFFFWSIKYQQLEFHIIYSFLHLTSIYIINAETKMLKYCNNSSFRHQFFISDVAATWASRAKVFSGTL